MKTLILPTDFTTTEAEFVKACFYENCNNAATWMAWAKHTVMRCPDELYVCDPCKAETIAVMEDNLRLNLAMCWRCFVVDGTLGPVTGQLSDNLRFIKL